ncbi:MAG: hypothetical protein ACXWRR_19005 [Bdellovibrio sp.]
MLTIIVHYAFCDEYLNHYETLAKTYPNGDAYIVFSEKPESFLKNDSRPIYFVLSKLAELGYRCILLPEATSSEMLEMIYNPRTKMIISFLKASNDGDLLLVDKSPLPKDFFENSKNGDIFFTHLSTSGNTDAILNHYNLQRYNWAQYRGSKEYDRALAFRKDINIKSRFADLNPMTLKKTEEDSSNQYKALLDKVYPQGDSYIFDSMTGNQMHQTKVDTIQRNKMFMVNAGRTGFRILINIWSEEKELREAALNKRLSIFYFHGHGDPNGFFVDQNGSRIPNDLFSSTFSQESLFSEAIFNACFGDRCFNENFEEKYKIPEWTNVHYNNGINTSVTGKLGSFLGYGLGLIQSLNSLPFVENAAKAVKKRKSLKNSCEIIFSE